MDTSDHRMQFPEEAVTWLLGTSPRTVAVLGNAALAAAFAASGHDVTDVEGALPGDQLPFTDRSVDAVVSTRGVPRDLDDVVRVLRPGGQVALVCTDRNRRIPWARKLDAALGVPEPDAAPATRLIDSTLFGFVSDQEFRHWQVVNNVSLPELLRAELVHLDENARERRIDAALGLYDEYGRGADGMQLPWVSRCFRATVVENAWAPPHAYDERPGADRSGSPVDNGDTSAGSHGAAAGPDRSDGTDDTDRTDTARPDATPDRAPDRASEAPGGPQDGSDSDLLLIDFR